MRVFAFPGQGSQYVGMGKDLYENDEKVKRIYDLAEEISGIPIKEISFYGPEERLTLTQYTQPAIFVYSASLLEIIGDSLSFDVVFGHSLGEFSALYAAGVFSFEDALKLVVKRGELMGKAKGGRMVAVIGDGAYEISEKSIEVLNLKRTVIANINSPKQVVVSGDEKEVEMFENHIKTNGYKLKLIPLKVSTAFHSPLMDEASYEFSKVLEGVKLREPKVPIIMNSTGKVASTAEEIYEALRVQLRSPVRFVDMINTAVDMGVREVWEVGPKKVLCGLIAQITDKINCFSAEDKYAKG